MKLIRLIVFLLFPIYLVSCGTQQRMPKYLENLSDTSDLGAVVVPELTIQKNDMLQIRVYSASTRPEVSDVLYNLPASTSGGGSTSGSAGGSAASTSGFLVDVDGFIEYPRIGLLQVAGLTKKELADLIKRKINEKDSVLTDPSVIVRFQNLKVTVIGEVNAQGIINIPGERMTVLEAVGLAGGLTDFGVKDKVKVIREIDGRRQVGIVDLSDEKVFDSPYYNLVQNDVVLVDPTIRKQKKADQDVVMRQVSFGLSLLTAFALLYNIFN